MSKLWYILTYVYIYMMYVKCEYIDDGAKLLMDL